MACSAAPMQIASLSGLVSSIAASHSVCQPNVCSGMAALPNSENADGLARGHNTNAHVISVKLKFWFDNEQRKSGNTDTKPCRPADKILRQLLAFVKARTEGFFVFQG